MPTSGRQSSPTRLSGAAQAIGAAVLFGAALPLSKQLLAQVDPWMFAGLLYLGSGVGLGLYRLAAGIPSRRLTLSDATWLGGAILSGGIAAPVLLMFALKTMSASGASLLLNAEGIFTALLASLAFREHIGGRLVIGMILIAAGAVAISWPSRIEPFALLPSALVLAACLGWAIDNNLMRRVTELDATWVAAAKGLTAGGVNLTLALILGAGFPAFAHVGMAMGLGLVTYGVSLVLFVLALRQVGAARTAAYFSTAPFIGAALALLLGEQPDVRLAAAGLLMGFGVWLHLTERHDHEHRHVALEHSHEHVHDEHHQHAHDSALVPGEPHTHAHRHSPLTHKHPHFPDSHHQHRHR